MWSYDVDADKLVLSLLPHENLCCVGGRMCKTCFVKRRDVSYAQAEKEIGPLSQKTHVAILKRVKQLERDAKKLRRWDVKRVQAPIAAARKA